MAPTSRPPRGRRLALGAGLSALVLLPLLLWRWPLVATRYHCFRLERCRTFEEARGFLEAIHRHASHPGAAEAVVGMLGPGRQWVTYWIFNDLVQTAQSGEAKDFLPAAMGSRLPILRQLHRRAEREQELLDVMICCLRWMSPGSMEADLERLTRIEADDDFEGEIRRAASGQPEAAEAFARLVHLIQQALARFLGMQLPGLPSSLGMPEILDELVDLDGDKKMKTWVREHRPRLRYDPLRERCVLVDGTEVRPLVDLDEIPPPAHPLPGWTGDAPAQEP